MNEVMDHLGQSNWQALTAISTFVVALAAIASAYLTRALTEENRLLRKVGTEPKVVAYLAHHPYHWEFVNFVLANVGKGAAQNVSFRFLTDEEDFESHGVRLRNSAERRPLGFLPQGESYVVSFGMGHMILKEPRLRPFGVKVAYQDLQGKPRSDVFQMDVAQFHGFHSLGRPPEQATADALKKIEAGFGRLLSGMDQIRVVKVTSEEYRKVEESGQEQEGEQSC